MFYKFSLIVKYFLYTNEALFRKSYLFQMASIYLASLIISLTLSIMDGMQSEIYDKVTAFNYKYQTNNTDLDKFYKAISTPENAAFTDIIDKRSDFGAAFWPHFNASVSEVARLNFENEEIMLEVHAYKDLLLYREKIKEHISRNSKKEINPSQRIIIGESLSERYNILLDDTLKIEDIVNINIVSGHFKSKSFIVSDIYNFNFLNYDMENVFIEDNYNLDNDKFLSDKIEYDNIYFDSETEDFFLEAYPSTSFDEYLKPTINKYSNLFTAIDFEKKLYMLIASIGIFISSIFIFNNTILVLLEKVKQFHLLSLLGINKNSFTFLCILNNLIISVLFCMLGLLSTFFIYLINKNYNVFDSFFIYTPFDKLPVLLSFNNFLLTFLLVAAISVLSTYLSIINMKKTNN